VKKYDLRSRTSGSKVYTFVQAKKTNTPVKSGSNKEARAKTNQQQKQPVKVSTTEVKESEKHVPSFSL
jgi:hypothetical protein